MVHSWKNTQKLRVIGPKAYAIAAAWENAQSGSEHYAAVTTGWDPEFGCAPQEWHDDFDTVVLSDPGPWIENMDHLLQIIFWSLRPEGCIEIQTTNDLKHCDFQQQLECYFRQIERQSYLLNTGLPIIEGTIPKSCSSNSRKTTELWTAKRNYDIGIRVLNPTDHDPLLQTDSQIIGMVRWML